MTQSILETFQLDGRGGSIVAFRGKWIRIFACLAPLLFALVCTRIKHLVQTVNSLHQVVLISNEIIDSNKIWVESSPVSAHAATCQLTLWKIRISIHLRLLIVLLVGKLAPANKVLWHHAIDIESLEVLINLVHCDLILNGDRVHLGQLTQVLQLVGGQQVLRGQLILSNVSKNVHNAHLLSEKVLTLFEVGLSDTVFARFADATWTAERLEDIGTEVGTLMVEILEGLQSTNVVAHADVESANERPERPLSKS